MSNAKIIDFVAAVATGQSADAVDFMSNEIHARVQEKVAQFGNDYRYQVGGAEPNEPTTTS